MMKYSEMKELLLAIDGQDESVNNRLQVEFEEIEKVGLEAYFEDIYNSNRKFHNDNNLLCCYLWGICPEDPSGKELTWFQSNEFPDLDIDFTPSRRNDIKRFCAETFGENNVVSIANYNCFGIKSGIRDIARILEIPLDEVSFTTRMDEDVNKIDWEDALETYPELKKFSEDYPLACQYIRDFNGRVRSIGKHAGGLVISSVDLTQTIPLITRDDPDSKQKFILSAFAEGQRRSDLKTVGLVKQDILGLDTLDYIDSCLRIMHSRGKYDPEVGLFKSSLKDREWSDEAYLYDQESIAWANAGDLKMVFQFDSHGIRQMVQRGGVTGFMDIVAYTSLYRPGPLGSGMVDSFIKRKNKEESYIQHPVLDSILGSTYGVFCYQEQIMQTMNKVGMISLQDCDNIRRAMGKKKEKDFIKYKDIFILNGQKVLGNDWYCYYEDYKNTYINDVLPKIMQPEDIRRLTQESTNEYFFKYIDQHKEIKFIESIWDQMVTFAKYGFNLCISPYSIVEHEDGTRKEACYCISGDKIKCYNTDTNEIFYDEVVEVHNNGVRLVYRVYLSNGCNIDCTINHEFLCEDGVKRPLMNILENNLKIICQTVDYDSASFCACEIIEIQKINEISVIDLEMKSKYHNFVANGIVVGNSHSVGYSLLSMRGLYLKTHFPTEYYAAVLSNLKTGDDRIKTYIQDARESKAVKNTSYTKDPIAFRALDINNSKLGFSIFYNEETKQEEIIIGFNKIKGVNKDAERLIELQPYSSFSDYIQRFGASKKTGETLILAGAFKRFDTNMRRMLGYLEMRRSIKEDSYGLGKMDFAKIYKEITGSKTCPKEVSSKFDVLLKSVNKKKLPLEDVVTLIQSGEFNDFNMDKERFISLLNECEDKFKAKILSYEEYCDQDHVKEMKDYTDKEKMKLETDIYSFNFEHPLTKYRLQSGLSIKDMIAQPSAYVVECIILDIKTKIAKNGNPYYTITLEDDTAQISVIMWQEQFDSNQHLIQIGSAVRIEMIKPSSFSGQNSGHVYWSFSKNINIKPLKLLTEPSDDEEAMMRSAENFYTTISYLKEKTDETNED